MWVWIAAILAGLILTVRKIYLGNSVICNSKKRLDRKTAIVTGSSAGIGKETARDLAQRGARVILACRNVNKALRVADDIIATTGNWQVIVREVDTSDLTSVRKFAKEILDTETNLHILVNNAGMPAPTEKRLTSDGLELTMATNHFGHFLMTNMLLGLLKESAPSRVVNLSTKSHRFCTDLNPDDLNYEKKTYPSSPKAYAQTKLCNILFTVELAEKLHGTGVTANCAYPGFVYTEIFWKEGNKIFNYISAVLSKLMGKDAKLGSQTTNYLAVSEEVDNVSGEFFSECKISPTSEIANDKGMAKKIWEASERLVKLTEEDTQYKVKAKDSLQN